MGKKFVFVSGRSSHTITAENEDEARRKIKKLYPYVEIRFLSEVPKNQIPEGIKMAERGR